MSCLVVLCNYVLVCPLFFCRFTYLFCLCNGGHLCKAILHGVTIPFPAFPLCMMHVDYIIIASKLGLVRGYLWINQPIAFLCADHYCIFNDVITQDAAIFRIIMEEVLDPPTSEVFERSNLEGRPKQYKYKALASYYTSTAILQLCTSQVDKTRPRATSIACC